MPADVKLDNRSIAATLDEYAALLELAGAGYYSARAYRRGAELVRGLPVDAAELVRTGRMRELRGIGPGMRAPPREVVEPGAIAELEELRRRTSPELAALGRMLGFGAKLGSTIATALGITSADELRTAAAEGRLREVRGIGPKTEARIQEALARQRPAPPR